MVDFERLVPRRNAAPEAMNGASALQSVVSMAELIRRPSRPPDHAAENRALIALVQEMAVSPEGILQKLADTALALCRAHSAGLSLLEEGDQERSFHWRAIAGQWAPHVNGGTPRDFGPCGTVLERNSALLFSHPERDFPYFGDVQPLLDEGLLIPFYIKGQAVGTIWVVAHDDKSPFRHRRPARDDEPRHVRVGGLPNMAFPERNAANCLHRRIPVTTQLSPRTWMASSRVGTRAQSGSSAMRPKKSSASLSQF